MSLAKYIARLQRMDSLIAMKAKDPRQRFMHKRHQSEDYNSSPIGPHILILGPIFELRHFLLLCKGSRTLIAVRLSFEIIDKSVMQTGLLNNQTQISSDRYIEQLKVFPSI